MSHSTNVLGSSYTKVGNYNGFTGISRLVGYSKEDSTKIPHVVIPVFGGIGYNVLEGDISQGMRKEHNGYFNVNKAYASEDAYGNCITCRTVN